MAPTSAVGGGDYSWSGVQVRRYFVPDATHDEIVQQQPHAGFEAFEATIRNGRFDVYHQHSWTRGCGLPHLVAAKRNGLKTVLTVHVPAPICPRGTLMFNGTTPCDGHIDVGRCTTCWGAARGIPSIVSTWQARHADQSASVAAVLPASRLQTAFATPALVERHARNLREAVHAADRVVAVCQWLYDALLINGVPASKLILSRQGVDVDGCSRHPRPGTPHGPLAIGFIGRWDPVKGIHLLVEAFRQLPANLDARLIVRAMPQDADYEREVRRAAEGLRRISFEEPVERDRLMDVLADLDLLAVPSQWLETGPLVALEAFAAGIPVLGSNLGGLKELLDDEAKGELVEAGSATAWRDAIVRFAADRHRSKKPIPAPRSAYEVALDMRRIYDEVLAS
jgi:glycosyltransferase involved in cell wall biosynthesis